MRSSLPGVEPWKVPERMLAMSYTGLSAADATAQNASRLARIPVRLSRFIRPPIGDKERDPYQDVCSLPSLEVRQVSVWPHVGAQAIRPAARSVRDPSAW